MSTLLALTLPYPFDLTFMQRALVAAVAIAVSAPLIGTFLVQRRMSLLGDGIGHVAFAGVAAGLLMGVWPVWTALVAAVLTVAGFVVGVSRLVRMGLAARRARRSPLWLPPRRRR